MIPFHITTRENVKENCKMRFPKVTTNLRFKFSIIAVACCMFSGIVRAEDPATWMKGAPPDMPKLPELPDLLPHTSECPEEYVKLEKTTLLRLLLSGIHLSGHVHERVRAEHLDELAVALIEYANAWRMGDYKTMYTFKSPKFRKTISSEQYMSLMEKSFPESPALDFCLIGRQNMLQIKENDSEFIFLFVFWWLPATAGNLSEKFQVMWWRFGADGWYCESLQLEEAHVLRRLWPKDTKKDQLYNCLL